MQARRTTEAADHFPTAPAAVGCDPQGAPLRRSGRASSSASGAWCCPSRARAQRRRETEPHRHPLPGLTESAARSDGRLEPAAASSLAPKAWQGVQPEPGLLLLPHLRMRVRAGHHLDRPHRAAAGGVLDVDQRVRQGYALGEHSQADTLSRLPSRPLGVTLSLGLTRRLAGCREDSAQLCLQTHPGGFGRPTPEGLRSPENEHGCDVGASEHGVAVATTL